VRGNRRRPADAIRPSEPPSRESQRGLDWLNFFMADVQTGFCPFVSLYLAAHGWSMEHVGFALRNV